MASMNILGFDPSLARTGWAALDYDTGHLLDCGVIATNPGDHVLERLDAIEEATLDVLRAYDASEGEEGA